MGDAKIDLAFQKVKKALTSLDEMAKAPQQANRGNIDAAIQRFEFTIELFWKLLKKILESKGVLTEYPKDVLREAYRGHLIDDENVWLSMLKDRNLTSHTYDEKIANEIYDHIQGYLPVFASTLEHLRKQ